MLNVPGKSGICELAGVAGELSPGQSPAHGHPRTTTQRAFLGRVRICYQISGYSDTTGPLTSHATDNRQSFAITYPILELLKPGSADLGACPSHMDKDYPHDDRNREIFQCRQGL